MKREEWQKKALDKANIDADENSFMRMGQIALFVKKCGISNVSFFKVLLNSGNKAPSLVKEEPIAIQYNFDTSKGGAQFLKFIFMIEITTRPCLKHYISIY